MGERAAGFLQPREVVGQFGIEPGMLVADFGAGSGVLTHHIAELLDHSGRVFAIDVQKDLLRRIKNEANNRGYHHVDVIWSTVEKEGGSKLADGLVDFVIMSNILFQLDNKLAALQEARRILKPSGRIIIIDWNESFGGLGPHPKDIVTQEKALSLAKTAGFTKYRTFPAGEYHYALIAPNTTD